LFILFGYANLAQRYKKFWIYANKFAKFNKPAQKSGQEQAKNGAHKPYIRAHKMRIRRIMRARA
jgi:hypothetical protein